MTEIKMAPLLLIYSHTHYTLPVTIICVFERCKVTDVHYTSLCKAPWNSFTISSVSVLVCSGDDISIAVSSSPSWGDDNTSLDTF